MQDEARLCDCYYLILVELLNLNKQGLFSNI
jgi:hypothetical protein